MIVNLEEKQKENPTASEKLEDILEKSFLTENGRHLAKQIFLSLN